MEQGLRVCDADLREATGTVPGVGARKRVADTGHRRAYPRVVDADANTGELRVSSDVSAARSSKAVELLIRLLDIFGSLAILVTAFPLMVVSALLVKLTSAGPVLYRQERVGKDGRLFVLYKFRTMIDGAEKHVGPVWAARGDDRITSLGRILRRTRLDELPQLYNILRGDMSLVGPRPERPYFVQRHKALQGARLAVKPGLTGLAQVRSFYDLKPAHKVKYDYLYIQKRSLLLNVYILLRTIPVLFTKKGW
ncbi:MAG: sugar transferase [Sedimentisphaerales bacterium]|nr:sugar transferase [Sedimentisphaerales bacterium]